MHLSFFHVNGTGNSSIEFEIEKRFQRESQMCVTHVLPSLQMYLNNLTTNKVYDLKVQAATRSQVGDFQMHFGVFSEVKRLLLQPGCENLRTFSPRGAGGGSGGLSDSVILMNLEEHFGTIAGVVCGTLGLLLAVFVFLILR